MGFFSSFVKSFKKAITNPVTLVTAAAATVLTGGTFTFAAFAMRAGQMAAFSAASSALAPQPKLPNMPDYGSFEATASGRTQMVKQPTSSRKAVYGQVRVGGTLAHVESTDNDEFLHLVIMLASHQIESFDTIYLNDEALTVNLITGVVSAPSKYVGLVRVYVRYGSTTQAAPNQLSTESEAGWTIAHRLQGIANIYVRLKFDTDAFPQGIPNVSALIKGKKVYDPRTSTTAYSNNPALCIRDYLLDTTYGLGASASEIDETSFTTAANICEESVTLAATGTENRYTMNGTVDSAQAPRTILEDMLASCGGIITFSNGKFKLKVAKYVTPTVSLDETDLRAPISLQTRRSRRDNYNAVKGIFTPAATNYIAADYPAYKSSTFATEDNGETVFLDYDQPYTTSSPTAQRLAKIALFRNRQQVVMNYPCNLNAFQLDVGDTVQITNTKFGFTNKVFEVAEWALAFDTSDDNNALGVDLVLRELNSQVFDWNADEADFVVDNTSLPNPFSIPAPSLSVTDNTQIVNQKVTSVLVATPSSTSIYANQFEVQAKKQSDTNYISLGVSSSPTFEMQNVVAGTTYDVRARVISAGGVKSTFTDTTHTIGAVAPTVPDVTGFSVNVNGANADMIWIPITNNALSHYIIRHSPLTSGATYQNATTVMKKVSRPANTATVPAQTGTYFIKAVDKLGNESANADESIVLVNNVQGLTLNNTLTEHPYFQGTKTTVFLQGTRLQLDTSVLFDAVNGNFDDATGLFDGGSGNLATSGEYEFANIIDLGNTFTATVDSRMIIDQFPMYTGAITNIGATNVELLVSTTTDDPNSSPTWSAYRTFIVGQYTARAFRFKALLTTTDTTQTPRIEELQVFAKFPKRTESDNDIQSGTAAGGKSITYSSPFVTLQAVAISVGDMQSGDFYAITNKTTTGFTITFKDSGNNVIDRTFDYVATGI